MSYATIKADCEQVSAMLQRIAEHLDAELVSQAEVRLPQSRAEEISAFLIGAAGLVHHLGTEQDAAGALLRQHSAKPHRVPK